jgi:phosphatidylserine/phosphatidylglycerophosphate/cardiolipin synthase-like enzyme
VQIYTFTSKPITAALIAAKARNVDVLVLMDAHAAKVTNHLVLAELVNAGVPVRLDSMHVIAHVKMLLVDTDTCITGSFNMTYQAEHRNAEMIAVIHSEQVVEKANAEFNLHWTHSK